ncbi:MULTISPECIES: YtfJ family protein [Providencia]|uniref:YtfJ family protein n=1 Tax=Providencia stuartii TaxID=588 RepID=A0ABD5L5P4_PROST|nr:MULTISPECIES: YtfJ family protein [Providencia]ELR5045220.1 YtfJ family protein [Providencia rettgeri]ELR5291704.1 YtfJ family protein [Providencia stuartii]MCR4180780.1 YtfJ family protein [Providencia vermicola]URE78356.1 YtfJ family protein [Providencia stuartii]
MIKKSFLFACLLTLSSTALASPIQLNQSVPPVSVTDKGEMQLSPDGKFSYQEWKSQQLPGKVRTIQHIAGRSSAKELNAPLIEAIKKARFPHDTYQTTSIINADDAIFGTGVFVSNSVEDSKKEFPYSQFIVDSDGVVKKAWSLAPESSAIILLNKEGKVLYFKDGALTEPEINKVITLIKAELGQ